MTTTMNNESRTGTLSDKTLDDILKNYGASTRFNKSSVKQMREMGIRTTTSLLITIDLSLDHEDKLVAWLSGFKQPNPEFLDDEVNVKVIDDVFIATADFADLDDLVRALEVRGILNERIFVTDDAKAAARFSS